MFYAAGNARESHLPACPSVNAVFLCVTKCKESANSYLVRKTNHRQLDHREENVCDAGEEPQVDRFHVGYAWEILYDVAEL